jgi:predicted permease
VRQLTDSARAWIFRLESFFGRKRRERELEEELKDHVRMLIDHNLRDGLAPAEARRQALVTMGSLDNATEKYRERLGLPWLGSLLQDLGFGLRMLRKDPAVTAVVVITLALGLGANTTVFSIVNGFLLTPLPVAHPEQIVALAVQAKDGPLGAAGLSYPQFVNIRNEATGFSGIIANVLSTLTLRADDRTDQFSGVYVSGDFFSVLGVRPALGRLLLPSDDGLLNQHNFLVLGYSFWQRRFAGDPNVIGKNVRINGKDATIIGVGPKDFRGMFSPFDIDGYLPVSALTIEDPSGRFTTDRSDGRILAFGRLKNAVSIGQAQNSLDVISLRLARQYPATDGGVRIHAIPERLARPQPYANNGFIVISTLFLAFAGLVLLLACLNVTNVVVARGLARQREMAVRAAVGAIRSRLIRQMLTETVLLALLGGVGGLVLALLANRLAPSVHLPNFPLRLDFRFDWRVYMYGFAAALVAGTGSGLGPALRASQADVNAVLRNDGPKRGGGKHRLHSDLVVAQIACSLMLLIIAGLFVRSLEHIEGASLGFDPENVLNVTLDPSQDGYDDAHTIAFYKQLEERIGSLPGVESVGLTQRVPIEPFPARLPVLRDSQVSDPNHQPPSVLYNAVDPGYFKTMRITLLRGRGFTEQDNESAPAVAVVNQTMAKRMWPGQDPIGQLFRLTSITGDLVKVIGVARDGKYQTVAEDFQPYFYLPMAQHWAARQVLEIRCRVVPEAMASSVQREIRNVAADVSIIDLRTMKQSLQGGTGYFLFRFGASLSLQMGLLGLILAVVGIYGVVSFVVAQRTREIGIRMALGADRKDIMVLVLRRGLVLIGLGVLIGVVATVALTGAISHLLLGVSAHDPATYAIATTVLSFVALLACWLPARRATRINPIDALRYE